MLIIYGKKEFVKLLYIQILIYGFKFLKYPFKMLIIYGKLKKRHYNIF
jgi:hypothetical protein